MHILNIAHFEQMTFNDRALQREVAELFLAQTPAWQAGLAAGGEGLADLVHTIKGSARNLGLEALANACRDQETGAANVQDVDAALIAAAEALRRLLSKA